MSIVRPLNWATPLLAVTVVVPPSVTLPGLLERTSATWPVIGVELPNWSSPATSRPNVVPAWTEAGGCCSMTSAATVDCGATEMESVFTGLRLAPDTVRV